MEFISIVLGFIIAFFIYRKSGLNTQFGIIGWLTLFWGFWIVAAVLLFVIMLLTGFLAKWLLILFIIVFVISKIAKR
ncbi:hypothetical protein NIE88_09730 [Sporolactobacillus shoreicorticis]|uniref:Uncharacterized protein n=1 Tax=Sporolactobacillus shoreicorticis TaxID=1923877 RepID=A0ABW5SBC3_9BACL|nr:hypothetical protein [Sporolactobacillus shoreicorticis]MCO7126055.1 hypothetical protein [Sporolactobacillus shoreicorticis]